MTKLTDGLLDRVRRDPMKNDDELRDSLKNLGWLPELPAIEDEHGRTLVGNRRKRIAAEQGISFVVRRVTFGEGDEADAGRVALAIASNIGGKIMTNADRRSISQYLFQEREWSIERIAKALNSGLSKIRKDIRQPGPAKDGPRRQRDAKPMPGHDKAREAVRPFVERGETIARDELAARLGVSPATIQRAELAERAAREARADPIVDPTTLPRTAQEKLAAALRQQRKAQDDAYQERLSAGIKKMLEDTVLPRYDALKRQAEAAIRARKGVMSRESFRLVLACLHPDSRAGVSDERLAEAFQLIKELELVLVADNSTASFTMPRTVDDLATMRRNGRN